MRSFIYCKKYGDIEDSLVREHGFEPISYETYDKFRMLFLGTINKKEESFCLRIKNGIKVGPMMTPDLAALTDKNAYATVLILTSNVVHSAGDIKAVLAFSPIRDKVVRVDGMCSNQVIKSTVGVILVKHLKDVCARHGIMIIDKKHYTRRQFVKKRYTNKTNKKKSNRTKGRNK